jgi:hypothetical protein
MKGPASIMPQPFFTEAWRNTNKGFRHVTCYCSIIWQLYQSYCVRVCGLAPLHKESLFGMTRVPEAWMWGAKQKGNKSTLAAYTRIFVEDEFKCHDLLKIQDFHLQHPLKQQTQMLEYEMSHNWAPWLRLKKRKYVKCKARGSKATTEGF